MTTNLSQFTKLGQSIQLRAGSAAINSNDAIEIGGPGNEAFSINTTDYATTQGTILFQEFNFGLKAMTGTMRQSAVRDALGNLYILNLNSSGNLCVNKFSPLGYSLTNTVLDSGTSAAFSGKILPLSNGTFAAIYARASGAFSFVLFDSSINIILGRTSIVGEFTPGNTVYHAAVELAGGGFAVTYQTSAGLAINLQTFSNSGAVVQTATSILTTTAVQTTLKMGQLPNGNLLVVVRNTTGPVGTVFVIVTTSGASVVGSTTVDSSATSGLIEFNILQPSGTFAVAAMTGSNMIASVYTQAGVLQGTEYSTPNTLNTLASIQFSLVNDGVQFWLSFISSANAGVSVAKIPVTGTNFVLTTGLGSATISATTYSLDSAIISGLLTVFAASTLTGGQYWMTVGLPDATLGIGLPYVRTAPTTFGTAAGTTGCNWPKLLAVGDWVGVFIYDHQTTTSSFFTIQRFESSRIMGVAQNTVAVGNPGAIVTLNTGPGSYLCNPMFGTPGLQFNQGTIAPFGNVGTLYNNGISLTGIPAIPSVTPPSGSTALTGIFGTGNFQAYTTPGSYTFTVGASTTSIRIRLWGGGQGGGLAPGAGATSSITSLGISATGGATGTPGVGTGGQFQATGGAAGALSSGGTHGGGGGGGGCGSLLGNGGAGGNAVEDYGGGGGGVNASAGAVGQIVNVGGGGGGTLASASPGGTGGPNTDGTSAAVGANGVNPAGFVARFPFYQFGGGGGGGFTINSNTGSGAVGGGGGGGSTYGGPGGIGGGGGGAAGVAASNAGGQGGLGGGGGGGDNGSGTGYAGGTGAGFAIGVFFVVPGAQFTVVAGAGGTIGTHGGKGGDGGVVIEY